jgi:hypothetical protein
VKYRAIVAHPNLAVNVGDVLVAAPDYQAHADDEARFNNRLFGLELDLVAISNDGRGFFILPRADLEPLSE